MENKQQLLTECHNLLKEICPIIDSVKECRTPGIINESKDYITEKYRLNNYNLTDPEKIKMSAVLHMLEMSA